MRNLLLNFVSPADPSASLEAIELIPSAPSLRPADIFIVAISASSRAALDVGVCCPDSAGSVEDACDRMWDAKREHYRPHLEEMANLGFHYYPLAFLCYGRLHPQCEKCLDLIGQQAARRLGVVDYRPILRRVRASIGIVLWRRAVAMVRDCLPRLPDECLDLAFGDV